MEKNGGKNEIRRWMGHDEGVGFCLEETFLHLLRI